MKKFNGVIAFWAIVMIAIIVCVSIGGCTTAEKQILSDVEKEAIKNEQSITKTLTYQSLKKAAVKSPDSVKLAAQALNTNIPNLITYFSGQPVLAADEVQALLSTKLGSYIPPAVRGVVDLAAVIESINTAIVIPPASKISADHTTIILNGLNGILDGANKYLDSLPPPPAPSTLTSSSTSTSTSTGN